MHFLTPTSASCSLRPMKIVQQADTLMDQAQVLYEEYEHIMKPTDRTVAEERMTFAEDFRHGVEEKPWLARRTQAKLYLGQAKEALETVKKSAEEAIEIRSQKEGVRHSGTWKDVYM